MPFILNEVEISLVQNYHWYMVTVEVNDNSGNKYIDRVYDYYPTSSNKFTPTKIQTLEEEIKSVGFPDASDIKIIAISYIGDSTKDKFI